MSISRWQSRSTTLLVLGALASSAPLVTSAPASAQANFSDVSSSYWARPFIETLANEGVISGFPDGTYKPDAPVTRAQFAAIVRQAFNEADARTARSFSDVSSTYWAAPAIREAYETGFMSGYPDGTFLPDQQIPKVQALVSLASGLRLSPSGDASTALNAYSDAGDVPSYGTNGVVAATQKGIVVNYPNVRFLNPSETATRADVAAFIYQALVSKGRLTALPRNSPARQYIVAGTAGGSNQGGQPSQGTRYTVAQGTPINVQYAKARNVRIVVTRGETLNNLTLEVANPVRNPQRTAVIIPKGSQIKGDLQPIKVGNNTGAQFRARQLIIGGQTYRINAVSGAVVTGQASQSATANQQTVTSAETREALGRVSGGQTTIGGIIDVITGQRPATAANDANDFIYINPAADLDLTVESAFAVGSAS